MVVLCRIVIGIVINLTGMQFSMSSVPLLTSTVFQPQDYKSFLHKKITKTNRITNGVLITGISVLTNNILHSIMVAVMILATLPVALLALLSNQRVAL